MRTVSCQRERVELIGVGGVEESAETPRVAGESYVVFRQSGNLLALERRRVREIVFLPELSTPPGMPRFIDGLIDVRGTLVPLVRLDRLFDLPPAPLHLYSPVVICEVDGRRLGLAGDQIVGLRDVPADGIEAMAAHSVFNECVTGRFVLGEGEAVLVLSLANLLLDAEREALAEFAEMENARRDGAAAADEVLC